MNHEHSVKSFLSAECAVMKMEKIRFVKVECFVPESHAGTIRLGLGAAGFGRIGRYDHCAAEARVRGHWRPLEGARPHEGRRGEIASAEEIKIEFVCRAERAPDAAKLIRNLHPYEEPLILVIPLMNDAVDGSTTDID
jgi:hypothetical protein